MLPRGTHSRFFANCGRGNIRAMKVETYYLLHETPPSKCNKQVDLTYYGSTWAALSSNTAPNGVTRDNKFQKLIQTVARS